MKTLIALLFVGGLAAQTPPMIPMATGGGPVGGATNLTTVGSVPYVSASGTLDQDAGQFFWDATNNRLGIGTATPGYTLEALGSSNAEIARVGDGTRSFGISTYTPNSGGVTLKNAGTGLISLTTANAVLIGTGYAGLGSGIAANTVAIQGNVGIGTTTPGVKLDVLGSARVYDSAADAAILLGSDQVDANSGKISYNRSTANLDITPRSTYATNLVGKLKFSITNSTGANSALLGANSPATILTAPYTWITVTTSDGTTGFMPIWK